MGKRTLEDALARADELENSECPYHLDYARGLDPIDLLDDIVLLADEVKRLDAELDAYKDLARWASPR